MYFIYTQVQRGNGYFSVPKHTPVVFGESGDCGCALLRLQVGDAGNLQEGLLLDETVPAWITDIVIRVRQTQNEQWIE